MKYSLLALLFASSPIFSTAKTIEVAVNITPEKITKTTTETQYLQPQNQIQTPEPVVEKKEEIKQTTAGQPFFHLHWDMKPSEPTTQPEDQNEELDAIHKQQQAAQEEHNKFMAEIQQMKKEQKVEEEKLINELDELNEVTEKNSTLLNRFITLKNQKNTQRS